MEYTVVDDPSATARHALSQKALQLDEMAFQVEFNLKEMSLISQFTQTDIQNVRAITLEAARKRREAEAYISESGISEKQILQHRADFLKRLIHSFEHSHVTHSAELKVKTMLGEPTVSFDSVLAALDRGHVLANQMLDEINTRLAEL